MILDIKKQAQQVLNVQLIKEMIQNNKPMVSVIMGYMKNMYDEAIKAGFSKKEAFELVKIYWDKMSTNL